MSRTVAAVPLVVLALSLLGCGGGGGLGLGPTGPFPSPDNARVAGRVVQADDVAVGLVRAVVSEPSTGMSTETGANGAFALAGLPAGDVTINVAVPRTADYDSATVRVPTRAGRTTSVSLAVLPASARTPTALTIGPNDATVEQGGAVQFGASVFSGAVKIDVQPTWVLSGADVGDLDATGLLQSNAQGSATVTASVGTLSREASVMVTAPKAPDISSVIVSATVALPVPASGGPVFITAAVSDGDGVSQVMIEIDPPNGANFSLDAVGPVDGTPDTDGTWRLEYNVPANDNPLDPGGGQAPQLYRLRVKAVEDPSTGRSELARTSFSDWYEFGLPGFDAPPPPAAP